jgi:serine/threonine protein kinase
MIEARKLPKARMPARYRILRKIADGGMAEIFLATQHGAEGFERRVVLKRILAALLADPKFRNMMIDEAHVAMSLNHSNIVQVLDLGQAKGRYFLALELVDGWDLNQLLARTKNTEFALPPEIALYIVAEVCRALNYAHGKTRDGKPLGIVHRDVSPHNVLVSEQGEVKLTDFGIAKALGRRERTGAGIIKGKLAFMSPEQASGAVLDARSDLFSVGTMLYLLLTGKRPFDAPTDLETILRVQQCEFPAASQAKPDLAPEVARIVERAMKRLPGDRYQTGEEMLVDVESAQRSVFRPAGQTELKRWLAELGQRDGAPPISRAATLPSDVQDEEVDLLDQDIIFNDTVAGDTPPPASTPAKTSISVQHAADALRSALAAPPAAIFGKDRADTPATPAGATPSPDGSAPPRRRWLLRLLFLSAAMAGGLALLRGRWWDGGEEGGAEPRGGARIASTPAPAASPPDPEGSTPAEIPATAPGDTPEQDRTEAAESPEPSASGSDAGGPEGDHRDQEEEDDEEALLRRQEPDVEEKVFGEEAGTPAAVPAPRKARTATAPGNKPSPAPNRQSAPTPARGPASVRIESRPEGAVVRIGDRVLGRAPMQLRFNSGITYELTFVKRGYQTTRKRYTVTTRKGQRISVVLRKKTASSAKKKPLIRRLFGF